MQSPDHLARVDIDRLLQNGRWSVQVCRAADSHVSRCVVLCDFEVAAGFGTASYLLDIDGMAFGETEANRGGATLLSAEIRVINALVKQSAVMTLHRSSAEDAVSRAAASARHWEFDGTATVSFPRNFVFQEVGYKPD